MRQVKELSNTHVCLHKGWILTAEICSTREMMLQKWCSSAFACQWFRNQPPLRSPNCPRHLKVKLCFLTYFATTTCLRPWNGTFRSSAGMKQERNQLSPHSCDDFGQQTAASLFHRFTNSTCTQPYTAEMDLIKPEARFYSEFSWKRHVSWVNKDEPSSSKDTAHKTSKPVPAQP